MSSSNEDVSISGLIENSLSMDMSLEQCIAEFIDNIIDAKASVAKFWLGYIAELDSHGFISVDNGYGMTDIQIEESLKMHNRNQVTKKNGKFGQGGVWASIVLTEAKKRHIRMSCTGPDNINMCEINWEKARAENKLNRKSHELTKTADKLWERFFIPNATSGTIDILCITEERYNELYRCLFKKELINNYLFSFSYMYNYWLEGDTLKLSFCTDKIKEVVPAFNPLLWKDIDEKNKESYVVRLYKYKDDENLQNYIYVYQKKGDSKEKKEEKFSYLNRKLQKNNKKKIDIDEFNKEEKHVLVCEFVIKLSVCDFDLLENKLKELKLIKQDEEIKTDYEKNFTGRYFQRDHRVLAKLDALPISLIAGTDWIRTLYRNVKTKIEFDQTFDDVFKIQVNKSKINPKEFPGDFESFLSDLTQKCFLTKTKLYKDTDKKKKAEAKKKEEEEKKKEEEEKKVTEKPRPKMTEEKKKVIEKPQAKVTEQKEKVTEKPQTKKKEEQKEKPQAKVTEEKKKVTEKPQAKVTEEKEKVTEELIMNNQELNWYVDVVQETNRKMKEEIEKKIDDICIELRELNDRVFFDKMIEKLKSLQNQM
jgi:hypothetical protein